MSGAIGPKGGARISIETGREDSGIGLSRAEAIANRVLVAVPHALARECSFRVPVALSHAAWEECVEWSETTTQEALWDVLASALDAIRRKDRKADNVTFTVVRVATGDPAATDVALRAVVSPGDSLEPVLTIYLLNEV